MTGPRRRSIQQYRPKGDVGAMPYSPQRDLANIYTPMLREVFAGLDEPNWSPPLREILNDYKITEAQLSETVTVFVEAHRLFIRDRTIDSPITAFERAGVMQLPAIVRLALFSRIGEVLTGGFFIALRDVTAQGALTPGHDDMTAMIGAGRAVASRLSGHRPKVLQDELERTKADVQETQRALEQSQQLNDALKRRIADNTEVAGEMRVLLIELKRSAEKLTSYTQQSFISRIGIGLSLFYKLVFKRKID